MWWSWVVLLVALAAAVPTKDAGTTDEELRCLLAEDSKVCPTAAPPAVAKLLRVAPPDLRHALATQGLRWSEVVALRALGPSLLPLLPLRQLRTLPASAGVELLRRRPDAAGLGALLTIAIDRDTDRRRDFLEGVAHTPLGARTEQVLGQWAANTFSGRYDDLTLFRRAGNGLLASIPAFRLLAFSSATANSFLFQLLQWRSFGPNVGTSSSTWRRAPALTRHAWATIALRVDQIPRANDSADTAVWTLDRFVSNGFLLEGCAPGDVAPLPVEALSWSTLGQLTLPPLTARSVLDAALAHAVDAGAVPPPPLNFSLRLLPRQLARLSPGHALRNTWANSMHAGGGARAAAAVAPLGSARTAALLLTASSGGDANGAGALAWALPPEMRSHLRAPSAAALAALDSPRFSRMEAERLLEETRRTHKEGAGGGAWLQARGLLRGLRASALAQVPAQELPQPLLLHLLRAFPRDAPAPAALALLQRMRKHLASEQLLNATLAGSGAGVLLAQLTPYELRTGSRALLSTLARAPPHSLRALPDRVFWAALDAELGDQLHFPNADAYSPSLLGLRCKHLRLAGSAGSTALLDSLNAQLRAARRPFPTALLRCSRQALAELLELRSATLGPQDLQVPAMSALRPQDAEAFGGAVAAGVEPEALDSAPVDAARALLATVGRLSLEELLSATGGAPRARKLAEKAAQFFGLTDRAIEQDKDSEVAASGEQGASAEALTGGEVLGVEALERMGSLRWLLPEDALARVDARALRFVLNAPLSHDTRAACGLAGDRRRWAQVLTDVFGPVESWTAGTLGAASGLLVTLTSEQRDAVPAAAWTDAADALAASWPFSRRAAPGSRTLLEECALGIFPKEADMEKEAVRHTARKIMEGARQQLRDAKVHGAQRQETPRLREAHAVDADDAVLEFQPPPVRVLAVNENSEGEEGGERKRRDAGDLLRASVRDAAPTTAAPTTAAPAATGDAHLPSAATTAATDAADAQGAIASPHDDWCGVIALSGPAAGFALTPADFEIATPEQLRACAETLGALSLSPATAAAFWERATLGVTDAEADWAADAGTLLGVAPPRKLRELSLKRLDVQAAVAEHLETEEMMTVAAETVWGAPAASEPLPAAALAATGAALCALPEDALARRAGGEGALAGAAAALGALPWPGCRRRCLTALSRLLTKGDVLGPADRWGAAEADVAGALAAGLPTPFKSLSADAVSGLNAEAVRCIPAPEFESLTKEQAESLRPDAAAVVSDAQLQRVCCDEARAALVAARDNSPPPALDVLPTASGGSRVVGAVVSTSVAVALTAAVAALAHVA